MKRKYVGVMMYMRPFPFWERSFFDCDASAICGILFVFRLPGMLLMLIMIQGPRHGYSLPVILVFVTDLSAARFRRQSRNTAEPDPRHNRRRGRGRSAPMVTRVNIDRALDNCNIGDWMAEDLKGNILARIEQGSHDEPFDPLQAAALYFYTLGRIRGIQSERRRKREKELREINATAGELRQTPALMELIAEAASIPKKQRVGACAAVIDFLENCKAEE